MPFSTNLSPPAWVTQPDKLLKALEFSQYFNNSFQDTTSHSDPSIFCKYITQFLYWKRRLAPSLTPNTVIFSLLGAGGLESSNIMDVILEAQKVCNLSGVLEFYQAANPKFIGISFSNSADVTTFTQNFTYYKDTIVAYVKPTSARSRAFSLLWLPPLFDLNRVKTLINKYSKHSSLHHGTVKIGPNRFLRTSTVRGTLTIKDDLSFKDIPHLIPLPSPHIGHALLIISGREPFCLKCLNKGHLRKDCSLLKCQSCNFFHSTNVICQSTSYAKRVSGTSDIGESYCWPDDVSVDDHLATDVYSTATPSLHTDGFPLDLKDSSSSSQTSCDSVSHIHDTPTFKSAPITSSLETSSPQTSQLEICHQPPAVHTATTSKHKDASINPDEYTIHQVSDDLDSCRTLSNSTSSSATSGCTNSKRIPPQKGRPSTCSSDAPLATYSRPKHSSKVRITSTSDQLQDAPRSLQLPYTPLQQIFVDAGQQDLLPLVETNLGSLFEDITDTLLSSDSDNNSDTPMSIDQKANLCLDPASRKRKGSISLEEHDSSSDALSYNSVETSLPDTKLELSPSSEYSTHTLHNQTPDANLINSEHSLHHSPHKITDPTTSQASTTSSSLAHPEIVNQLTSIFTITTEQASLLVSLCPNQPPTADTIKCLKLLSSHGIGYTQIITQPFILKFQHSALHRKVRYLTRTLGAFTINDITHQGRVADTINLKGGIIQPSGIFHDT